MPAPGHVAAGFQGVQQPGDVAWADPQGVAEGPLSHRTLLVELPDHRRPGPGQAPFDQALLSPAPRPGGRSARTAASTPPGNAGCEVLAVSSWLLGRDDQIGCLLFWPIDHAERRPTYAGTSASQ